LNRDRYARLLVARAAGILPVERGFHAQINGTNARATPS
jgi:hypothetical protein